ncbi:hypothetical protein SteCoe_25201 [Stentor coeruleus]|uniref:AMP-dependent synthetase/ligase domain-containing protein n=1 Tax=Stentor coeruleus TaxID=5963 RepID=A0A1R2BFT9_9CILI|nr:hypothetical protein SteCoe_25201 [Stentor coeruleus]
MGGANGKPQIEYMREVPNTKVNGYSSIYRNPNSKNDLQSDAPSGGKTLYENFMIAYEKYGTVRFLGSRMHKKDGFGEFQWKIYAEVREASKRLGYGLHQIGADEPDDEGHSFVGIYSKNRYEWLVADFACISQNIVSVPLYDVQQAETIEHIVGQTQMKVIFCSEKLTTNLIKLKKQGKIDSIRYIIQFEAVNEQTKQEADEQNLTMISFEGLCNLTKEGEDKPPSPDSWFTICYTSGTTGKSKGAVITHKNMISMMAGMADSGFKNIDFNDVHLSYLPLAHMFDRAVCHFLAGVGGGIGFFSGDIMKLKEDLAELKPTLFVSVPRLYCRFYDTIKQMFDAATGAKGALIRRGLKAKYEEFNETGKLTNKFWDALVFNKVKAVLGGRVRLMVTGSAPIAAEVINFLKIVFSCPIVEGYGQTETCAGSFVTSNLDGESGMVGGAVTTIECRLMEVPDMNYLSTDVDDQGRPAPRGEVCIRGDPIFKSYYKNPEQTAEALDDEGWLHTGDIGVILAHNKALKLVDRKKNFFKLAQGEYVASEKIEIAYSKSFYVSQIFVYGDSLQSYLIAIVVPEEMYIRKEWAHENGYNKDSSFAEMCNDPKLKAKIMEDMAKYAKEEKLLGFEVVKKIVLEPIAWTVDDLLTPTQKLMRFQAKKKYQSVIEALYKDPL